MSEESQSFRKNFEVKWSDLDPNRHLRNTAYSDYATHVRFSYLAENGFTLKEFQKHGFGPVVFREETIFKKEVGPNRTLTVNFKVSGLAEDGSRWSLLHEIALPDGKLAARLTIEGAWIDLKKRKLITPPSEIFKLLNRLPKTEQFEELEKIN